MYSLASKEVLNKISRIFPGAMLCDVHSHPDSTSINDFIERIVQRLPLPAQLQTSSAIMNMKDVVDGQQLKIQMSMMDQPHPQNEENYSDSSHSQSNSMKQEQCPQTYESYWNPQQEQSHMMADKYLNFLI